MDLKQDYYKILELSENATREEIRSSFRRLAKKYHPDKNQSDIDAEEKFKLINEAYEILSNDILRHEYDDYKRAEAQWRSKVEAQKNEEAGISTNNIKTFHRTRTIQKETRIYVRGKVNIKYWADPEDELFADLQSELRYKIFPTEVRIEITETDIHPVDGIPLDYLSAFKESEIFKVPIPQPVKCIIKTSQEELFYQLELRDIRIKSIKLEGVTKHEKQSLGTLVGDIYAFNPRFEVYEETEEVTECFGETGNIKTKEEGGISYYSKEYYHPDCTTYWGSWIAHGKTRSADSKKPQSSHTYKRKAPVELVLATGCLQWWWAPLVLIFLILNPKLILGILILAGIMLLFSFAAFLFNLLGRLLPLVGLIFFFVFLTSAIRSFKSGNNYVKHDAPSYDTLNSTKTTVKTKTKEGNKEVIKEDSIISHFIRWQDYDNQKWETTLSASINDIKGSALNHKQLDLNFYSNSLSPVYSSMLIENESKLEYIYKSFDSIKNTNNLNQLDFAKVIVSCIQSIPYFLVVDQDCSADYDDQFTRDYLATCNRDCCIGYEKYGVRSPVEFVGDLKGDCDTRALFLYQVFKHYNYNVALLTSSYYRHALIAINIAEPYGPSGVSKNIHNRNYLLWETTSAGFDIGIISQHLQNIDYWDIALLNENKFYE